MLFRSLLGSLNGSNTRFGGFSEPCGVAVDQSSGDLYVGDFSGNIWRYNVSKSAPATAPIAENDYSGGITTDSMFQIVIKTIRDTIGKPASVHYQGPSTLTVNHSGAFSASGTTTPNTGATITSFSWNFGDGHTASGVSVHHAYAHTGQFTVTLSITDSSGVVTTSNHQVKVTS